MCQTTQATSDTGKAKATPTTRQSSDPNNATLHSDNVPVAEAIVVSVAATVIAAVMLNARKRSKIKAKN